MTLRELLRTAAAALALACAASFPTAAHAGTYEVRACHGDGINAAFQAFASNPDMTAYSECPGGVASGGDTTDGMIARHVWGAARAPALSEAAVYADAPPGARITSITGEARFTGEAGWDVGVRDQSGGHWIWCGPDCSSSYGGWYGFGAGGLSSTRVGAVTICGLSGGCRRDGELGHIALHNVTLTIADDSTPWVSVAREGLGAPGWHRGVKPLVVNATDNVGIRRIQVQSRGRHFAFVARSCNDHLAIPCPTHGETLQSTTSDLPDGRHDLAISVADSAGNVAEITETVFIDNTPPERVDRVAVDGEADWRSSDLVTIRWVRPTERGHAALTATEYEVCPADVRSSSVCQRGHRTGAIDGLEDLRLPGPGLWTIAVWLRDAAGNHDARFAQRVTVGVDQTPPEIVLERPQPADPARLVFRTADALSGVARGEVEIRRHGEAAWQPVTADLRGERLTALLDDEVLPRGTYEVRARVVDHAGNERSTDRYTNGDAATLVLPLRMDTRLRAGRRRGRRLIQRTETHFGRRLTLSGRLTAAGSNPLGGREIEVFERADLPDAEWSRVGAVRTSRSGRFHYRLGRGSSRTVRFRFPGSPTIRATSREVAVAVRASGTMRSSRRSVVNGQEVTFGGRVRGRPLPPTGKLLQLQAFSRGEWLTFATPRADARTGRWSYRYRFAATRGRVKYRFRTRIPREAVWPFAPGASRTIRVLVRGL